MIHPGAVRPSEMRKTATMPFTGRARIVAINHGMQFEYKLLDGITARSRAGCTVSLPKGVTETRGGTVWRGMIPAFLHRWVEKTKYGIIFHEIHSFRMKLLKASNENIKTTLQLVKSLLALADKGDLEREDVGCGILYGIVRDSAYKIKKLAEAERALHIKKGKWS